MGDVDDVPEGGASLILSFKPAGRKILVIGTGRLAALRVRSALESDARAIVVGSSSEKDVGASSQGQEDAGRHAMCDEIRQRISRGQCLYVQAPEFVSQRATSSATSDAEQAWGEMLDRVDGSDRSLLAVCVTDTLHVGDEKGRDASACPTAPLKRVLTAMETAAVIYKLCRARRIPVNVADQPDYCDFSFPATHRFSVKAEVLSIEDTQREKVGTESRASPLQIAVTTNGQGCRLAGRIRREIVTLLPSNVGDAVDRIGQMRRLAKEGTVDVTLDGGSAIMPEPSKDDGATTVTDEDARQPSKVRTRKPVAKNAAGVWVEEEDQSFDTTPLNSPVPAVSSQSPAQYFERHQSNLQSALSKYAADEERKRRMRWVAQMSEYWPIEYIGNMSSADMQRALDTYKEDKGKSEGLGRAADGSHHSVRTEAGDRDDRRGRAGISSKSTNDREADLTPTGKRESSQHNLELRVPKHERSRGHIFLVGSGPGHPGLLTAMAVRLLTSDETDVILSDKLVPSSVLALVPQTTTLHIARKFPGNAEGAQSELISLAIEAAQQGKRVVRLKQGDPFIYGRGGEEVLAFRKQSLPFTLVPGLSSAIAAPLLLGMPVTQRGAADSLVLCTGVGRGGKQVEFPGYKRGRSLVVLMGVARIRAVVSTLCRGWKHGTDAVDEAATGHRSGAPYPAYLPIAVIERASSNDQRCIATTLEKVEEAVQACGEQRPPGMMLIGWAVLALEGPPEGNVDVLDAGAEYGGDEEELERRDRERVQRWLGKGSFLLKQGLDEYYRQELSFHSISRPKPQPSSLQAQEELSTNGRSKGEEWAPPRYGVKGEPRGGWAPGESGV